jgi:hypothetical protein
VYLRARYYDPGTGQFISRDPIEALTREPYGYTGGNPLNRTDPEGLNWISDRVTQAAGYVYDHRKGIAQGLAVAGIVVAGIAIAPIGAAAVSAGLSSLAGSVGMSGTAAMFAAEIGGFAATANTLALTSFVLSSGSTFLTCQDGWTTACKISLASTAGGGFLSRDRRPDPAALRPSCQHWKLLRLTGRDALAEGILHLRGLRRILRDLAMSASSIALLVIGGSFVLGSLLGERWERRPRHATSIARQTLRASSNRYRRKLLLVGLTLFVLGLVDAVVR